MRFAPVFASLILDQDDYRVIISVKSFHAQQTTGVEREKTLWPSRRLLFVKFGVIRPPPQSTTPDQGRRVVYSYLIKKP